MTMPFFKASLLASAICVLAACGGGGGGSSTPAVSTGVLTDSPVAGVTYSTSPSNQAGTTNTNGEYNYRAGDTVTFTLGGVALPPVPATGRITPATMAAHLFDGDAAAVANATLNLAVLFQTLDDDQDPDGGITMGGATLTGFTPSLALAQAPATFAATLDAALPVGLNPVSAQDAIHHYYGNELTGTWRATAIKETIVYGGREETDIENPVLSNDLGFLFSFDPEGRFIYSTWDVTSQTDDERFGDIAIGQVEYPSSGTTVTLTGNDSRLLSADSEISSTDPSEPLIRPHNPLPTTIELQGEKVVITNTWEDDYDGDEIDDVITSVFTLERLENRKDGLTGTWVESEEDEDSTLTVNENGTVDFGDQVKGIYTYYLSDSLLVFVVLDRAAAGDDNERNGIVVASYSRSGNTITLGTVKYDGVSKISADPVFDAGDTFTNGPVSSDGRTVAYNYGGGDIGTMARLLTMADVASFVDASTVASMTGSWSVTEVSGANTCEEPVGASTVAAYSITQAGTNLSVQANGHTYTGALSGNSLNWTGSYPEDGGTTTQTTIATLSGGGNSFSGTSSWSWTNGEESCTGSTTFTGTRS